MHFARQWHAACAVKTRTAEYIVVTGSQTSPASIKAEKYDVAKNSWTILPDMCTPHTNHGMCAIASTVYVFFGDTRFMGKGKGEGIEFLDIDSHYYFYPDPW